jgi:hypothetical protein
VREDHGEAEEYGAVQASPNLGRPMRREREQEQSEAWCSLGLGCRPSTIDLGAVSSHTSRSPATVETGDFEAILAPTARFAGSPRCWWPLWRWCAWRVGDLVDGVHIPSC